MRNARNGHSDEYFRSKLNFLGTFFWRSYLLNISPDCDGVEITLVKKNPFIIVMLPIVFISVFFVEGFAGVKELWRDRRFGLSHSEHFRKNPELIEYISRRKVAAK